jgi:hypothetical protein
MNASFLHVGAPKRIPKSYKQKEVKLAEESGLGKGY